MQSDSFSTSLWVGGGRKNTGCSSQPVRHSLSLSPCLPASVTCPVSLSVPLSLRQINRQPDVMWQCAFGSCLLPDNPGNWLFILQKKKQKTLRSCIRGHLCYYEGPRVIGSLCVHLMATQKRASFTGSLVRLFPLWKENMWRKYETSAAGQSHSLNVVAAGVCNFLFIANAFKGANDLWRNNMLTEVCYLFWWIY